MGPACVNTKETPTKMMIVGLHSADLIIIATKSIFSADRRKKKVDNRKITISTVRKCHLNFRIKIDTTIH